jgi:hypothetical protein
MKRSTGANAGESNVHSPMYTFAMNAPSGFAVAISTTMYKTI